MAKRMIGNNAFYTDLLEAEVEGGGSVIRQTARGFLVLTRGEGLSPECAFAVDAPVVSRRIKGEWVRPDRRTTEEREFDRRMDRQLDLMARVDEAEEGTEAQYRALEDFDSAYAATGRAWDELERSQRRLSVTIPPAGTRATYSSPGVA